MKKRVIFLLKSWPVALTMLCWMAVGAATGYFAAQAMAAGGPLSRRLLALGLALVLAALAVYAQIVAHELGHMLFGLATGFRFSSFRIGSLMLVRANGRFALKRFSIAGTGGQCLMIPPEDRAGALPVMLYNLGGAAVNLLLGGALLALGRAAQPGPLRCFLMVGGVAGMTLALTNGLPMQSGLIANDGHNALTLVRHPAARRALYTQLDVNAAQTDGLSLREMPDAWFVLPQGGALGEPMQATLVVLRANRLMEQRRFAEADALMKRLMAGENAVSGLHKALMACDRAFIEMLGENRADVVDALLGGKAVQAVMKQMGGLPQVMRTKYALALLQGGGSEGAQALLAALEKVAKAYPFPADIATERALMALARERADRLIRTDSERPNPCANRP